MAVHINKLNVENFRSICDLIISDMNHVNILTGDNNCGKTSIFEAMLMLRHPEDFTNILRISRLRDAAVFSSGVPIYENFMDLFQRGSQDKKIGVAAICADKQVECKLCGINKTITLDAFTAKRQFLSASRRAYIYSHNLGDDEIEAFSGKLNYRVGETAKELSIEINANISVAGREMKKDNVLNMVYLSATNHVQGNTFNKVVRNEQHKELCLDMLRIFDKDIKDFLIVKHEGNNRAIEYIEHHKNGIMPLSNYGDGIKKILSIANGITQAEGGVLLIDKMETAIHPQYQFKFFDFVVKSCKKLDVQLFLTTHNKQVINAFLATQNYAKQKNKDDIKIIKIEKVQGQHQTKAHAISGREWQDKDEAIFF